MIESPEKAPRLERALGLKEATAINMIDMVGIGPFVVIPLVIKEMNGAMSLLPWALGAFLALIDAFVWSELGSAMPKAGGSYVFLREIYGSRWGKLMSFLFIWQTTIQAPLAIASGAIGFSQYASYLHPLSTIEQKAVSGIVVILLTILLYRRITTIGKISLFLWSGVILTVLWIIGSGAANFDASLAFGASSGGSPFALSSIIGVSLGHAMVKTIYSYLGYYNVCHLGSEIEAPERNIPRSIFISIIAIAVLYMLMQTSVLGVVPWREAAESQFIFSTFIERIYGLATAQFATIMILWIAFASLFALVLGYSRIPYAAALDGRFFKIFAKTHPTKHFPHISLLVLAAVAFVFSLLFRLGEVISAVLAMRIVVQFVGQAVGVMIWRRRDPTARRPFRMWLFPLPAILAIVMWAWLFTATGVFALAGLGVTALGVIVFMVRAKGAKEWPFALRSNQGD